jgi:hypothetical protein
MHPDMLDAKIHTLLDKVFGDFGAGEDEYCVHFVGDGFQIWIAGLAMIGRHPWVYRIYLIPILLELLEGKVATSVALI